MPPTLSRLPSQEFSSRGFKVIRTPYFSLGVKKNNLSKNRAGIIAGKAVHKSAVRRNFWRRQAKAALADIGRTGNDFLIIFSPKVNELGRRQFRLALKETMPRTVNQ